MEGEALSILEDANGYIRHAHFADPRGRVFPLQHEDHFAQFFAYLKKLDYTGGISVEAFSTDFKNDARMALELLRSYL